MHGAATSVFAAPEDRAARNATVPPPLEKRDRRILANCLLTGDDYGSERRQFELPAWTKLRRDVGVRSRSREGCGLR